MKIIRSKVIDEYWDKYWDYKLAEQAAYIKYDADPSLEKEEAWSNARDAFYAFMDRMAFDILL